MPVGHRLRRLTEAPPGWGPAIPMPALRHNPRREGIPAHRKGLRAPSRARPWRAPRTSSASARQRWCAVLAVVPLRSPSPGAVCRTPACHECEPLAVRTPACGFEWRAIPLAGWLSGFEPSHIGCRGVPRGGWVGGKPSLPGAACSALGGSGGAPRVVLLGRGSSFPLPPRKARDTHCLTTRTRFPVRGLPRNRVSLPATYPRKRGPRKWGTRAR